MSLATRGSLLVLVAGLAACNASPLPPATVHLRIEVPAQAFTPGAELTIAVVGARQLAWRDRLGSCDLDWNGTTEALRCPPGVIGRPVEPELFRVPVTSGAIELDARTLALGDSFALAISGVSFDGCNRSHATVRGIATPTVAVRAVAFATTDRGCPPHVR